MGGSDLGAQAGTYLVRFSTRTKIWPQLDEQNRENDPHFAPPACAAALTQQVKLSLGSTQLRCTIWGGEPRNVENEVEDAGVNCGRARAV